MSIDLNWDTLTGGPDGAALAERIRDFIHTKFQTVPLPRFIKSVTVHDFEFGSIPPQVVLKDLCDPLPDFYEEDPDLDYDDEGEDDDDVYGDDNGPEGGEHSAHVAKARGQSHAEEDIPDAIRIAERRRRADLSRRLDVRGPRPGGSGANTPVTESYFPPHIHTAGLRSAPGTPADLGSPFLGLGASTPGIHAGASNMHYFQSKLATGWPGAQTPLAAVAGAQNLNGRLDMGSRASTPSERGHPPGRGPGGHGHSRHPSQSSISVADMPAGLTPVPQPGILREKHSVSTLAPTSAGASRPPTRDALAGPTAIDEEYDNDYDHGADSATRGGDDEGPKYCEPRVDDLQAVFRIKYAGDVKLMLTAEILLDYPMPSFVGIPVKLNITGLTFDGVGVVAYIRKRVHFCFLSPEDALAAVGHDDDDDDHDEGEEGDGDTAADDKHGESAMSGSGILNPHQQPQQQRGRLGGLLQEIRVESEIGQREGSKQSLKNVGKVEKFVLEQVRRIFEEEFVYPSFWTFLV
ncbi:hypothetical protein F4778DRAFT_725395 [Xylariomycetidae sp. FL2044]|nr:hypothetical protein F4778DRAFT_725395 [Xylariomycetidae sp. FL2044]